MLVSPSGEASPLGGTSEPGDSLLPGAQPVPDAEAVSGAEPVPGGAVPDADSPPPDDLLPAHDPWHTPQSDPLLALSVVAAICLVLSAVVLPWVRWGASYQDVAFVGISVSLWDVLSNGAASGLGAGWMQAVVAGMAAAVVGTVVEVAWRPVNKAPRLLALAGFGAAVGASCVGLVVGAGSFSGTSSYALASAFGSSLQMGFWAALAIAVVGSVVSLIRLTAPPNPPRRPEPFARSPWGPPPAIKPAGYYPPGLDPTEYVSRGEVPPGYVPPSYREAVYPKPGHVTPAYTMPGHPGFGFGPPYVPPGEDAEAGSGSGSPDGGPARGHLVVIEDGRPRVMTVEPGMRLVVGRDPDVDIRVSDRKVSERHATIERRGDAWAVQDIDAMNPTRLIDAWGTNRQIRGETTVDSGQLVVGDVLITLYPSQG